MKRKHNPTHLHIIRLFWLRHTYDEIAMLLGVSLPTVHKVVTSDYGRGILELLESKTLDTTLDVQAMLQAAAIPAMEEKIRLATESRNDAVRNAATKDILEMAGHSPIRKVSIEKPDAIQEKYQDMTEDQLKAEFRKVVGVNITTTTDEPDVEDTIH